MTVSVQGQCHHADCGRYVARQLFRVLEHIINDNNSFMPECAQCLLIIDVSWADCCHHRCFRVSSCMYRNTEKYKAIWVHCKQRGCGR